MVERGILVDFTTEIRNEIDKAYYYEVEISYSRKCKFYSIKECMAFVKLLLDACDDLDSIDVKIIRA